MNYENLNNTIMKFSFEKKYFYSIFGLYLFSLGSLVLGYSFYLLLETTDLVERTTITWNAQGLFWFLILFCVLLIYPVDHIVGCNETSTFGHVLESSCTNICTGTSYTT